MDEFLFLIALENLWGKTIANQHGDRIEFVKLRRVFHILIPTSVTKLYATCAP
jgi:hypothetical protein